MSLRQQNLAITEMLQAVSRRWKTALGNVALEHTLTPERGLAREQGDGVIFVD